MERTAEELEAAIRKNEAEMAERNADLAEQKRTLCSRFLSGAG